MHFNYIEIFIFGKKPRSDQTQESKYPDLVKLRRVGSQILPIWRVET